MSRDRQSNSNLGPASGKGPRKGHGCQRVPWVCSLHTARRMASATRRAVGAGHSQSLLLARARCLGLPRAFVRWPRKRVRPRGMHRTRDCPQISDGSGTGEFCCACDAWADVRVGGSGMARPSSEFFLGTFSPPPPPTKTKFTACTTNFFGPIFAFISNRPLPHNTLFKHRLGPGTGLRRGPAGAVGEAIDRGRGWRLTVANVLGRGWGRQQPLLMVLPLASGSVVPWGVCAIKPGTRAGGGEARGGV